MSSSREVLTQEEISALLETATDSAVCVPETGGGVGKQSGRSEPYKKYWKTGSSNIIPAEEFDSLDNKMDRKGVLDHSSDDRYIKSTRVKLKYRLKKAVPFLELLLEYGNGALKKGDSVEVSTREGKVEAGFFEGFFYEREIFEGGILLKSGGKETTVEAGNIAIDTDGGFVITSKTGETPKNR